MSCRACWAHSRRIGWVGTRTWSGAAGRNRRQAGRRTAAVAAAAGIASTIAAGVAAAPGITPGIAAAAAQVGHNAVPAALFPIRSIVSFHNALL